METPLRGGTLCGKARLPGSCLWVGCEDAHLFSFPLASWLLSHEQLFGHRSPTAVEFCYNLQINRTSWPWDKTFSFYDISARDFVSVRKRWLTVTTITTGDICSVIMRKHAFLLSKPQDTGDHWMQERTLRLRESFHVLHFYMPWLWCLGFEENPNLFRRSQLDTAGMREILQSYKLSLL